MTDVTIVANDVGGVGGMELVLAKLVTGLVDAGDRVTVIARTADVPEVSFTFHRVRGPARPFVIAYPWFAIAATRAVRRHRSGIVQATGAIVFNRVDVVSIHFCHRAFGRQPGTATASRSTPIYRAHARAARALARVGERLCLRANRADRVVAVSQGVAAEMRATYPRLASTVAVIPNGVDRDVFSPGTLDARRAARARFGIPDSGPCALFIGGDWGRKGLQFAIDALAEASDWHLAVAGRGDTSAYRDLARHAGVVDRVHFLGIVRDSPDLYRAADALVLPTAYETFSLVAYEAASAGLPLLATAVSGIEDILIDGVTGLRIERDASQIASRLRAISAAPEIGPRMGAAARRATEGYTWGALISRHRALYAELRAKHRDGTTGRDTQPAGE